MPDEPPSQMIRVPTPLVESVRELSRLHRAGRTKAVLEGIERLVAAIDSETEIDIDSVTNLISTLTFRLERLESERESEEAAIDIASLMLSISDLTERLVHVESDIEAIALTLQDLNVRMSDLEGMGDIGYTTSRLSELEALDDIGFDIDLTAAPPATADIATDSSAIAESQDRSDISTENGTTAEVGNQFNIATDSNTIAESPPQPIAPLTQSALAKRLGISDKAIQKHRLHGEESFAQWSRDRDPDGIAWTWEGRGGRGQPLRFVPLL
ncbi:hypothetical protein [Allocoleopsis franciscana]|uniref:Uncharacterized protein n=1 Tax=Allocoleopsis franciscana PCC 7113 TaxID=1173027 RepID=K9WRV0_9CYAN|nr:hypothetical protein [Allocoleopsis franciscana]AFZ22282.1 hypothetical protein Mic7113_6720 [Allocoleopsis franciscana PCC 7113]